MSIINSLPDSMKHFVEEQIAKGGFRSESEYLQVLIREAQIREAKQELEAKLLEGLQSPVSPMTPTDWVELKQQVLERSPELKGP
jgi:antitoxin ParD1/3/4